MKFPTVTGAAYKFTMNNVDIRATSNTMAMVSDNFLLILLLRLFVTIPHLLMSLFVNIYFPNVNQPQVFRLTKARAHLLFIGLRLS
jgi:hypothetical protein